MLDLNALKNNLKMIRDSIKSRTRLLLMLKADAYGHGAEVVALTAEPYIDYLGVANAEEGVELRKAGIEKPILISVFSINDSFLAAQYNLTPLVWDIAQVTELDKAAKDNKIILPIHIKLDTGMNRLGIKSPVEFYNLIKTLDCFSNLKLEGICTHYFDSDISIIDKQQQLFDSLTLEYRDLMLHTASSSSLLKGDKYHYDMVRIGIAAYGYTETNNCFQPVMSVVSTIITIKKLNKGESTGYSGIYKALNDTNIAVLRGGYYDGIRRDMVGGKVIINNALCPIVAVCMDTFMVDIGYVKAKPGDNAIILGTMSNLKNTATEIARHIDTIPYEILTGFKGRIERIYYG